MPADIFASLPGMFKEGVIQQKTVYYFTLDDLKKTVTVTSDTCTVADGKTVEHADCVCKTSRDFFLKIWNDGYQPGMKEFLNGTIRSNAPQLLRQFMAAFAR